MGGGNWTAKSYCNYAATRGVSLDSTGSIDVSYTAQDLYKAVRLEPELDPKNVLRECCDSEEHPNTIPVILAIDVTGSMGPTAAQIAKKLNPIMTKLYENVQDVEFLIMGIGDLSYDDAPIQASQFESDIRIAEQLDKIYFEAGGGGNAYESYTAAWYFGLCHTKLDCWKRGKKGIIITMGDEPLNPYLPKAGLEKVTGDRLQAGIETRVLYEEASQKFDIYHLAVSDKRNSFRRYERSIMSTFGSYLDNEHLRVTTIDGLENTIVDIITKNSEKKEQAENGYISW